MDPIPKNFPILNYVMTKLPTFKRGTSTVAGEAADDFDVENPPVPTAQEPHFEIAERMPRLKNQKLVSEMRRAVSDVAQTRSTLQSLGTRPDHETVDTARLKLAEFDTHSSKTSEDIIEDYKVFKAVIALDEMHEAYERMLSEAERRLEKIYEAAVAGEELNEEEGGDAGRGFGEEEMNEEVIGILKDAESGKVIEKVDLSGRRLRIFPEAFGKLKTLVVLNMSNNQLEVISDSIAGLENLEELNLSGNILVSLPDSIGLLFKLKILNVSGNKLTSLPDSISHCSSLRVLDASYNKLTYLPTNIGFELVNLERLSIHLNKIRSLPTSIGQMKSLKFLDAHFNELSGLPHSIGKLTNLEIMNLSSNFSDLTELPDSISDLICLKELDLSNNQLHALPNTFGRLMNLSKLKVDQNPLVIPPKEVVDQGVVTVKAYMTKRWEEMLEEEEKMRNSDEMETPGVAGILTRSTSWLTDVVTNLGGTVSGYLGGTGKSNDDPYLNQQL